MKKKFARLLIVVMASILSLMCSLFGCAKKGDTDYFSTIKNPYPVGVTKFSEGYGTTNMGYAKRGSDSDPLKNVDRLINVVPNQRQLDFLELEYYNFIHFGMNTFTGDEWGTGKESPKTFHPTNLDTDQWCEALKASGSKGVILTAKHHDGFALWQTATTEHSVKNSDWKDGKGDVVKELSESCKKYGLKLGIYLSPWDMNAKSYGTNAYNDFFVAQLTELCTNYGELFTLWFDGARGQEVPDDFVYDFDRWFSVIERLQPNAVTAIQGVDVRWIGNEAGVSRENEWSVVGQDYSKYQASREDAKRLQSYELPDMGSREVLSFMQDDELRFYPAEVDVSLRKGWFYHKRQKPKELDHLMKIYFKAVGGNGSLLLNIPPNKEGKIDEKDASRLKELGDAVRATQATTHTPTKVQVGGYQNGVVLTDDPLLTNLLTEDRTSYYELGKNDEYMLDFHFAENTQISRIDIREALQFSQRIEKFELFAKTSKGWQMIGQEGCVGNRRTVLLKDAVTTDTIRLVIKQSRDNPHIRSVTFHNR